MNKQRRPWLGFGLIEVLVAMAVFALGIMASFSIQTSALRTYHEASQQLIATNLARDIIARIRSNPGLLTHYTVERLGGSVAPSSPNCHINECSPRQIAQFDLANFRDQILGGEERFWIDGSERSAGGLADARACIRSLGRVLTVIISWRVPPQNFVGNNSSGQSSNCGVGIAEGGASHTQSYAISSHIEAAQ